MGSIGKAPVVKRFCGVLYRVARELGATKIALGHHADDFIETLLLNLLFSGALKAMPAKLVSDDGEHVGEARVETPPVAPKTQ